MDATLTLPWARARYLLTILICAGGIAMLIAGGTRSGLDAGSRSTPAAAQAQVSRSYGELPLSFQPNRGQTDRRVLFQAGGAGYGLFLTRHRAVLALGQPGRGGNGQQGASPRPAVLSMRMLGSLPNPAIAGARRLPGHVNYLRGDDPRGWHTRIPTFSVVRYSGVWPGIGMSFYGNQRRLEYDFDLAPGARAGAIRLRFSGQRDIRIDPGGSLRLDLGGRAVRQPPPRAYQEANGERRPVASRYVLLGSGRVGVIVGAHDPRLPLTIDPQLVYSSYLGGGEKYGDNGNAIAVDQAGHAYVTGSSFYSNFPITPGAFQAKAQENGPFDTTAFVTEFNPSGSGLVYSTYLSGSGNETVGLGIAVDAAGNAYVTGRTTSNDFPTTPGAFGASGGGVFVTKLNPSGSGLVYSTLFGAQTGEGDAIAVDAAGNAYVTGSVSTKGFPTTPGAFRTIGDGAFVTKINPAGSGLVYSTHLAGGGDNGNDIAVDPAGDAYVTGSAGSNSSFPTTPGAFRAGGGGAFATKLDPSGAGLIYSTLLGDSNSYGGSIAVDPAGDAYVAGTTTSAKFPTTAGAFQVGFSGNPRAEPVAFVTKLDSGGTKQIYSTYLGGATGRGRCDCGGATGLAVDAAGDAFVSGRTGSKTFPTTTGALQRRKPAPKGYGGSGFVSGLNPAGSGLVYSTYLGGYGNDGAEALAVDAAGHVFVTGTTVASNFPITSGAFQRKNHSGGFGYAAFVTELDPSGPPLAGLATSGIERRGNRLRINGILDPAADGTLTASVRLKQVAKGIPVSRDNGRFVAKTGPLERGSRWKIEVRFEGHQPWDSESVCRRIEIDTKRPSRWTRLPSEGC
ncbi:MAG TPA: SBBP repeat-containing protein [Solirubrobacterales bacterium]|nr:SBBP repeat-containing protein [Solirubrobacterales bacterium]